MITKFYIIGQCFGLIAWLLYFFSFRSKRVNKAILLQTLSSLFYCLNYAFLGAWAGFFVSLFDTFKAYGYYKTDKDKLIFLTTMPVYVIIGLSTEFSWLGLAPIIASLIDGYIMLKSKKVIVVGGALSSLIWLIYDIAYLDIVGSISDLMLIISNLSILVYGYTKFLKRDNVYTVIGKYISNDTMEKLHDLDKGFYDPQFIWNLNTMKKLYMSEKNSYILVKDNNHIIGYVNILNLSKEIYDNIINSDNVYDNFKEEDIVCFNTKKNYYLSINSIVLKNEYQNKDSEEKICQAIQKFIRMKQNKGYKIKAISSVAVNDFEIKVLEKLEFNNIKNITNEIFLYEKQY